MLEKSRALIRVRRLAGRTTKTYFGWRCRVSAATQNQAFSAILFLTPEVMGQALAAQGQGVRWTDCDSSSRPLMFVFRSIVNRIEIHL